MAGRTTRKGPSRGPGAAFHRAPRNPKALVPRQRLYSALDAGTRSPLTMVVGPAGTGKTVLLSSWLEQAADAIAGGTRWENAHDDVRVGDVLLMAAGMDAEEARHVADADADPTEPASSRVLDALVARLEDGNEPDLVVLDDAHLLPPWEVEILATVLSARPDSVRLLIATRRDLPLPVFELELQGSATMVREGQLRFTPDESERLVRQHLADASPDAIRQLTTRAGGWAAALVLGAHAMAGAEGDEAILSALGPANEPVVDFLLSESFNALSEPVRALLLCTFEEPELTATRAVTLTGQPDAGAQLSRLASAGLLVTAYARDDAHELSYAYHPLLTELLRRRTMTGGPETAVVRAAHRRAALDGAAHGTGEQAVRHAIASRDVGLIARLVLEEGPALIAGGAAAAVGEAYAVLAPQSVDESPEVCGVFGLYLRMTADPRGAIVLAARAQEVVETITVGTIEESIVRDAVHADVLILQLWKTHFGWQNQASALADAREALGCTLSPLHEHRPTLVLSPERQSWLMLELGTAELWAGALVEAAVHVDEGLISAGVAEHDGLLAWGMGLRSLLELLKGNAHLAADTARRGLVHADRLASQGAVFTDRSYLALAWSAYIKLEFKEAQGYLDRMSDRDSVTQSTTMVALTLHHILESSLLAESGLLEDARRALVDPVGTALPLPPFLIRALTMTRWSCASMMGDTTSAAEHVRVLEQAGFKAEADLMTAIDEARGGRFARALESAEHVLSTQEGVDHATVACAAAVKTGLLVLLDDPDAARLALLELLTRTAPQELLYVVTLGLVGGPDFVKLLSEEARRTGAHPFARTALDAVERYLAERPAPRTRSSLDTAQDAPAEAGVPSHTPTIPANSTRRAASVLVNGVHVALTDREMDVLEQLALGSSYHEIGLSLYITENTVKTHLASLYRKLGVERRSAALRLARELGLI